MKKPTKQYAEWVFYLSIIRLDTSG